MGKQFWLREERLKDDVMWTIGDMRGMKAAIE
jgi:hypothetical protein